MADFEVVLVLMGLSNLDLSKLKRCDGRRVAFSYVQNQFRGNIALCNTRTSLPRVAPFYLDSLAQDIGAI